MFSAKQLTSMNGITSALRTHYDDQFFLSRRLDTSGKQDNLLGDSTSKRFLCFEAKAHLSECSARNILSFS